jgi:hypothetical protein
VEDTGNENEGINNIHQDPRFVNPARGDYHLLSSSPCIDAGAATAPSLPLTDSDGEPIPFSNFPDIGADEFVDSDGDTLPDFWERKWFGGFTPAGDDDPDSDHLSNSNELLADTDPLNPDTDGDNCLDGVEFFGETDPLDPGSFFEIIGFSLSGPQVTLRWTTAPGRWYQAYFSDDFLSWQAIGAPLKATGDSLQSTLTAAKSISVRFFTVKALP